MGDAPDVQQQQQDTLQPAPNAALAATAPVVQGAPDLATAVAQAFLQHTTRIAQNSPIAQQTKAAEQQKAAAAAKPVDENKSTPSPGSFGDKLSNAFDSVSANLGDVAHAHDTPGGWLSGAANVAKARTERLAQQKKDQQLLAKTQAETVALHRNIYQQDQAIRASAYKGNQDFVDTYKVNHDVEDGITHDDLMKRATTDKDFANKFYVRATSEEPVLDANGEPKKDKDGNPVTTPLYTIVNKATKDGSKDDKSVTADMSGDIKKYLGLNYPPNTKLTADQFAAVNGQMNLTRNAVNVLASTNEKDYSDEQMKVLAPYLTDPTIQAAVSHVPGSAYAGLVQYSQNADAHIADLTQKMNAAKAANNQQAYDTAKTQIADLTDEKRKVDTFTAQAISPKQIERYDKEGDKQVAWVDKVLHDPSALSGDKASAIIPQLQTALQNEVDPGRRAKLTSALDTAKVARDNYFEDMSRKSKAEQAAKEGNPVTAGKMLAAGDVTLADLRTRGTTTDFIENAITEAKRVDPTYNAADEVNFEHVAKSPTSATFFGSARSLMSKGGTMDQLTEWGKKIPDNGLPTLNTIEDWEKLKLGKGPLAGYAALVLGVADDYGKVMGGGTASDSARDAALHLFAAAQTQEQRADAINATLGAVGSQFDGRVGNNKFLAREYGDFVRSPLSPKTENQLQQKINDTKTQPAGTPSTIKNSVVRPKDVPTATGAAPDPRTGKMYWHDASGKVIREVKQGELPNE